MNLYLPDLPYDATALEPHVSADTLRFHHGKHHRTYVDTTRKLVAGGPCEGASLEAIIMATARDPSRRKLFNNAAQAWNHAFYWRSMTPHGGGAPDGRLSALIDRDFNGLDGFRRAFTDGAMAQFGSGWAWLVQSDAGLAVRTTGNAGNPLVDGDTPLATLDLWEHAYYLDYQNRRAEYVAAFVDHLLNWDFVAENLESVFA